MSRKESCIINNAALMEEWDWKKNNAIDLFPESIYEKSSKKAWWRCKQCGHSWKTAVCIRSNGHGCPICSRKIANSQPRTKKPPISDNKNMLEEWDHDKNCEIGLYPDKTTCGSSKMAWWICKQCGHSWCAKPSSRERGAGCPACARKKAKATCASTRLKSNALSDSRPELLEEWDYGLNGELTPNLVTASSSRKVWWRCTKCNQAWRASVAHRSMGSGCPVCAGQKLLTGVNDLATTNSKLASEWDFDNNELTPQQVSARNNIKVAWVCSVCGYHWKAYIATRNNGTGCPQCQKRFHTSMPEQIIFYYIKKAFADAVNGITLKYTNGACSVDIFIPSLHLAIEYDGSRWHKDTNRDMKKTIFLKQQGIQLIRVRELDCPEIEDESYCVTVKYTPSSYQYLIPGINSIFDFIKQWYCLSVSVLVDIETDYYEILSAFQEDKREESLEIINPDLASEWDFNKNAPLTPCQMVPASDKRVWWKCGKCGYSWIASVYDRNNGSGCPRCAGLTVWEGANDLKTKRPELIMEWDYERNFGISPAKVAFRSDRKVWWTCRKCGCSWRARVADRSAGSGCPACAGKIAVVGQNDLATINPELAAEWDYGKNGNLTPQMVVGGSNKKVWWVCKECAHSWKADIYSRNTSGHGCPICGRKKKTKNE